MLFIFVIYLSLFASRVVAREQEAARLQTPHMAEAAAQDKVRQAKLTEYRGLLRAAWPGDEVSFERNLPDLLDELLRRETIDDIERDKVAYARVVRGLFS